MNTIENIETGLNSIAAIGATEGGRVGVEVVAGLQAGEAVVNSVVANRSAHEDALTTVTVAADTLATAAAPIIASLPEAAALKAKTSLSLLQTILFDLKAIFFNK
jgi:hypothetical protein